MIGPGPNRVERARAMPLPTRSTAPELREHLQLLYVERALAEVAGLAGNAEYMADLEDEIATERTAYVGAAVTEIATLRADLSAPLRG